MTAAATARSTLASAATPADGPVRRVLMLTHRLPYPPDRGDRIRSYHMLRHLAKHFEVGVACTSEEDVWLQHHQLLRTMAKRVVIQPISSRVSKVRGVGALALGRPITPACYYRPALAETILQWHEQQPFDAVLTFCTGMIQYARLLADPRYAKLAPAGRILHVLDLVDVDSAKWEAYADESIPPMKWVFAAEARRLRRIEAGQFDRFDAITVVSAAEAQAYRDHVGDHAGLSVVRNGVDIDYFSPLPDENAPTLVFVGVLNYRPNAVGIEWFVHHVMPLLRAKVPAAKLLIVGRHPTNRVEALGQCPGVEVVGSVPDVRVYLRQASVAIAPLRIARGVQNKVLEAMACRRAVVCSPGAATGVDATDGQHLLVADSPQHWADQITSLITNSEQRNRIAAAARQRVEQAYCWDRCMHDMVTLLNQPVPA